jgi:F0F1-type ATP synthase membrane subunit b/b'
MDMTLRDLGELVVWVGAIATALGAIGAFAHFVIVRPLRNALDERIREVAKPARQTAEQLETKNGITAGEYIEDSARTLHEIRNQLQELTKVTVENRILALDNARQFSQHLVDLHGPKKEDR